MPVKGSTAISHHARRMADAAIRANRARTLAAFGGVTNSTIERLESQRQNRGVSMDSYLRTLVVCAERLVL